MKIREKICTIELNSEEMQSVVQEIEELEDPKNPILEKENPGLFKLLNLLKAETKAQKKGLM